MLALPAIDPGLATFYDRTIESQIDRDSPFSVWGQDELLEWLQTMVKAFAVGLAVLVAFVPRAALAAAGRALSAAVLIAVQLTAEHWFYLYIPWFFGLAIMGLVASTGGEWRTGPQGTYGGAEPAPARSTPPGRRRGPRRPRR